MTLVAAGALRRGPETVRCPPSEGSRVGGSTPRPRDPPRRDPPGCRATVTVLIVVLSVLVSVVAVWPVLAAADHGVDVTDLEGAGTAADPYRITNASELQAMADDLDAHYVLVADVDASNTSSWNGGAGFEPVGSASAPFTGTFDGDGHVVSGLTIDRFSTDDVGLFGVLGSGGTITDARLENVTVVGNASVGGLVGTGEGVVRSAVVSGTVVGDGNVGGLVGHSRNGLVTESSTTATVWAYEHVGGLVGWNENGTVRASTASGNVTSYQSGVGGLVGWNENGTVRASTASGNVTGNENVGGLVGQTLGTGSAVERSSAAGTVVGSFNVGGLVGLNQGGAVRASVATGNVSGEEHVGGLVGFSWFQGTVTGSAATGTVTGDFSGVGGLVGVLFDGAVVDSSASGNVDGWTEVGGLIGRESSSGLYFGSGLNRVVNTSASGNVTGVDQVGGLVGLNFAADTSRVERSTATGTVTGEENVGGLVGQNLAFVRGNVTVVESSATGDVSGETDVGGLVGENVADDAAGFPVNVTVDRSLATGDVVGVENVSGLVGRNVNSTISRSYATGAVAGEDSVGGLVGLDDDGAVTESYATGALTGGTPGNGLVGALIGNATVTDSYWDTDATGVAARDNMTGFDVPGTWLLTETYPALAWEDVGPFLAVNVTGTTGPVDEGDTLRVTASVTNYGRPGTGTVSLYDTGFGDIVRDEVGVSLDTDESESVTLSWTPGSTDSGTGALTVASGNDTDSVVVTVNDTAPGLTELTAPTHAYEGVPTTISGTFTGPRPIADHTVEVHWGDGTTESVAVSRSGENGTFSGEHTYAAAGSYTVTVTVTDDLGANDTGSVVVTADDATPAITELTAPPTVHEGTPVTVSGTFVGPRRTANHTVEVDWGDGTTESVTVSESGENGTFSGEHTYADDGTYTVTATVTDDTGANDTASVAFAVSNVAPVVTMTLTDDRTVGETVRVTASFTDDGVADTHNATVDWGDGTTESVTASQGAGSGSLEATHVYTAAGNYSITVSVSDDDGGVGTATDPVEVTESLGGGGGGGSGSSSSGSSGGGLPGPEPPGEVQLLDATLTTETITAGSAAVVEASLANYDPAGGQITLVLTADGAPVTERTVSVGASSSRTVTLEYRFTDPGSYALAVNGDPVGTVVVEERPETATPTPDVTATPAVGAGTPTTAEGTGPGTPTGTATPTATARPESPTADTPASGPGFTVLLALVALVLVVVLRPGRRAR